MGRPQVSIRLGTTGRSDVERDFAAIGDSGDAQAKRYQASWERASAGVEAALERQAKAATRLSAVGITPVQQRINATTGVGSVESGGAKAAAAALAAELEKAEQEARQLLSAIDPLFAATTRYEAQVERINAVKRTGQITEEQYQQLLAREKLLLDEATAAGARNAGMRGQMRMGAQQLGFQMNDVASQLAMGTRASVIFAQQSAQVVQALQLMGGEGNAFLRFLGGPWGIALSVAVVALTPFIGKLFESKDALAAAIDKLKEHERQLTLDEQAHNAFAHTVEGSIAAMRELTKELDKQNLTLEQNVALKKQAIAGALTDTMTNIGGVSTDLAAAVAKYRAAQQTLEGLQSGRIFAGENPLAAQVAAQVQVDAARQKVEDLTGQLNALNKAAEDGARAIRMVDFPVLERNAKEATDRLAAINRQYDDMAKKAEQAAAGNDRLKASLGSTLVDIERRRKIDLDAEKEKSRGTGGTAIFNEQIASFFDEANKYRGLGEKAGADKVLGFLHENDVKIDSLSTKWCAAFVNAVLAKLGVIGTNSLKASSFLTFGKDDTKSPQRGDIAVVKTKAGEHVGFVDSVDKAGNVKMLGGNTSDKVAEATYSKSQVLAIRRPPTPSESAAAANKAASDQLQAQQAFDSERERLNQQLLGELRKVAVGYEAQATIALRDAQADHDSEAQKIATNLAQGDYGDKTSKLAQTRAQQLIVANDALLKERQDAVAADRSRHAMEAADAAVERDAKYKLDGLEYAASIATTARERKRLQLEIIDVEYKEKERHLQYLLALDKLLGNTEDAAKVAAELAHMPEQKRRDQDKAGRDNQSPFEAYRDELNKLDAGEGTQSAIVDGLKSLNAGLDDAIMKSKSFKDLWHNIKSVFHDVAASILKDLIDMAIKMLIIKPIMNLIAGGIGGGPGGFATGTEYAPGGTAWVGEHGPELVRLPRGSKVFTAAESRRMSAANDSGPMIGSLTINGDFRGADASAVDAIQARLDDMENTLPGKIVGTMNDARERFVWRGR